jgi:hypothetical protein
VEIRSTPEVARLLGVSVAKLSRALWLGQIDRPQRGPGGGFLWTPDAIERASWQLCGKPLDTKESREDSHEQ